MILPERVVGERLETGDEIGIFDANGRLCGAALYQGRNTAVTLWGDDRSTDGSIEGLEDGEAFVVKSWELEKEPGRIPAFGVRARLAGVPTE